MALPRKSEYTIEDIYNLPEGTRAELIDGHIYYMAPPNARHQRILKELVVKTDAYIKSMDGSCEVYPAPFAVFLSKDAKYVEPDINVICDKNKLNDSGCNGAPDWIIEIVSPGSKRMDYHIKLFKYRTAGAREYWIVDPDKNRIMIHNFESEDIQEYTFSDSVNVGIYSNFTIDFSQLDI